ncbi:MAG TPA: DNA gyrase inhibitor YacG [Bryobacteraceae bacterium]|nr:DNA gyrase inhibitor YacG [Bryobacteraceae bacterium]HOQ47417.1 DNA gyrase inhibitor YacG [Bryobacteraceae bacterium]HPQ15208.1 DNA gyrase inhibitor YacG [Bryobacteraceae bacterium]HPU73171.1 DNA gyrase inhibitor YacG [Bryobacteraceae bacterium]
MKCPICKKEVAPGGPYVPFCSDRCRLIDLGNWASEKYRISTPLRPESEIEKEEEDEHGEY